MPVDPEEPLETISAPSHNSGPNSNPLRLIQHQPHRRINQPRPWPVHRQGACGVLGRVVRSWGSYQMPSTSIEQAVGWTHHATQTLPLSSVTFRGRGGKDGQLAHLRRCINQAEHNIGWQDCCGNLRGQRNDRNTNSRVEHIGRPVHPTSRRANVGVIQEHSPKYRYPHWPNTFRSLDGPESRGCSETSYNLNPIRMGF